MSLVNSVGSTRKLMTGLLATSKTVSTATKSLSLCVSLYKLNSLSISDSLPSLIVRDLSMGQKNLPTISTSKSFTSGFKNRLNVSSGLLSS